MQKHSNIGFIQGRLSPIIDGRIQCFPWGYWENEFKLAGEMGLRLIEWTLDQDQLHDNPIMSDEGRSSILELSKINNVSIPSLTGDCFMQAPFWKSSGSQQEILKNDFEKILQACQDLDIEYLVVPLVDAGRLENIEQKELLGNFLMNLVPKMKGKKTKIVFESDEAPVALGQWIESLPEFYFGINYDIGNSASLGYKPLEEFESYGHRVLNLHIKDRILGGTTVALGEGAANFDEVFKSLKKYDYRGNYILQTARSSSGDHVGALNKYIAMTESWIEQYGL